MSWLWSRTEWLTGHGMGITLMWFAFTLLAGFVIVKFIKRRQKVWMVNQLPGPKGIPLLGNAFDIICDNVEYFHLMNSYCDIGEMVRLWVGPRAVVPLSSPSAVEVILTSQKNIDKSKGYQLFHPWLGTGLLTSSGRGKKRLAFLDRLLEASEDGKVLSTEDIREEVDTFMFEGHDTTATGINFALYLMGRHPEIQARVQEELDSIFGDSDRPATIEDLQQMKYLENCIKESQRMLPSVPIIGRTLKEDLVINNKRVPAGVNLAVMIFKLHRNPEHFPDPNKFDPDRFLPDNVAKRHPFAYVPFSAGPRNCIGQRFALLEEKVVLSNVLRNFRVSSDTPESDLKLFSAMVLRPHGDIPLRLFPRSA